jgi:phytanoyl-CoA hydroxylase
MRMTMTGVLPDVTEQLTLTSGEINFYRNEGYLLVPNLLRGPIIDELRAEVLECVTQLGKLAGLKFQGTPEFLGGGPVERLVMSRAIHSISEQLLGGPSTLYLPFMAVKGSGGGQFHFHQDNQYTRLDGPAINCWIALVDMSPENGCLNVVPRSHLNGTLESTVSGDGDTHKKVTFEPQDFLPVRMHAGDCIAFSRLTVHGSGPNHTEAPRVAYALQYHRDDVNALWPDGQWKLLKDHPKRVNKPVAQLTLPKGKTDGH